MRASSSPLLATLVTSLQLWLLAGSNLAWLAVLIWQRRVLQPKGDQLRRAYELTENMPAGTYVVTLTPRRDGAVDLAFRFASRRFLEMFGVELQALQVDPNGVLASIHPDDRDSMNTGNARAFATNQPFRWEGRLLVDGVSRWVNISSNPRLAPDGVVVWEGVVIDISERVQAEAALQRAAEREIEAELQRRSLLEQKLKTSLAAAAVVHEIQQPLAALLLNAGLAARGVDQIPGDPSLAALRRQLHALGRDGDRIVAVMERVRLLLRNVDATQAPCDLIASIESAVLFLKPELKHAGVQLTLSGLEQPCPLLGDGAQLQIALFNLMRNAAQAMAQLPPDQRRMSLTLHRFADRLEVRVADSGPGLPEGFSLDLSFDLLKSTKATGMGLGLFLAQTAATNHRGRLVFGRSAALGGAEVTLVLPLPAAPPAQPAGIPSE